LNGHVLFPLLSEDSGSSGQAEKLSRAQVENFSQVIDCKGKKDRHTWHVISCNPVKLN
jgi:hypothetical protein